MGVFYFDYAGFRAFHADIFYFIDPQLFVQNTDRVRSRGDVFQDKLALFVGDCCIRMVENIDICALPWMDITAQLYEACLPEGLRHRGPLLMKTDAEDFRAAYSCVNIELVQHRIIVFCREKVSL